MPYKPKHPCAHPGCPELVRERTCDQHRKEAHARYNKYQRDPATARRYGTQWRQVRARYIAAHPLCELCETAGRLYSAEEVHHKLPLANGGTPGAPYTIANQARIARNTPDQVYFG